MIRGGLTICIAWIAWSQVQRSPWLDTAIMGRYLAESPWALVHKNTRLVLPLFEIVGGFAWLLQLSAPLMLWNRLVGKYWAVLLIFVHAILAFFMPIEFWNLAPLVSAMAFLPEKWLTFKKEDWTAQRTELTVAGRVISLVLVTNMMLFTVFDRNIAEQFDIFQRMGSAPVEKAYEVVTNPFVKLGNLLQFNSIWKMYSPTWRKVVWIEWYLKDQSGATVNYPEENFSPDYRMHRRTWLETFWTDFKKEKIFIGMLSRIKDRQTYAQFLCQKIIRETGVKPVSVHSEINSFAIRGPEENWSLKEQKAENTEVDGEVTCD